ncbi:hypothetical protein K0U07_03520 [bacterium]|nr:hypothetical protein [bacterium]
MAIENSVSKNFTLFGMNFEDTPTKPLTSDEVKFATSSGNFEQRFSPEQKKIFQQNLCMTVYHEMQRLDKEREKASKKLRASVEGKEHNDDE